MDSRRTKTNRRRMMRSRYQVGDFDFAILYLEDIHIFYVMPIEVFSSFKSGITLVEKETRQRRPRSWQYREAWDLLTGNIPALAPDFEFAYTSHDNKRGGSNAKK